MLKDKFVFVSQFFQRQKEVGALIPSSDFLANKLAEIILPHSHPLEVMEVGPGTGSTTEAICRRMGKDDHLTLVEANASFCKVLEKRVARWRRGRPDFPRVTIFNGYLQDFRSDIRFDHILCGLPLNNFPMKLVTELFAQFKLLSKEEGCFSYFEYMGVRKWNAILMAGERRQRFHELNDYLTREIHPYVYMQEKIWLNLFPAVIWHLYFHQKRQA
ncbi:MAG: class I SAM-dependent methyltransferase [Bacteriovoracia bacterium]